MHSVHDVRGIFKNVFPHSRVSAFLFLARNLSCRAQSFDTPSPFFFLYSSSLISQQLKILQKVRLMLSVLVWRNPQQQGSFLPLSDTSILSLTIFSWELGTRSQAILELNASAFSVFSSNSLPPPSTIPSDLTTPLAPFFAIARSVVSNRTVANNKSVGPQPFLPDGSAGDPASIGMCVLLANWTNQDGGQIDYAGAAKDQLDFLFQQVPMTVDGAISHRVSQVQLW